MSGKNAAIILSALFLLTGCAEPVYETVLNNAGDVGQQKITDCKQRFGKSGYCLLWQWEKMPTSSESGILQFKIVRPNLLDDSPVPVEVTSDLAVVLWMPSMGHGSRPTKTKWVDIGSYRVTNVFFVMPGEWQIKFLIKDGDQIRDESIVTFTF